MLSIFILISVLSGNTQNCKFLVAYEQDGQVLKIIEQIKTTFIGVKTNYAFIVKHLMLSFIHP